MEVSVPLFGLGGVDRYGEDGREIHPFEDAQADYVERLYLAARPGALPSNEDVDIGHFTVADVVQVGHLLPYERLVAEVTVEEEGQPCGRSHHDLLCCCRSGGSTEP